MSGELICERPSEGKTNLKKQIVSKARSAQQANVEQAVAIAVQSVTDKLGNGEMKPSVGDFVRLLELQQQMITDDLRDLRVSWEDSLNETESITDE